MKKALILLAALMCLASWALCQDYGSLYGTVTDKDGVALGGVTVTISSVYYPARSAVTSEAGTFRFPRLPIANDYVLKFELLNFKTVVQEKLKVEYGKDFRIDIVMEPTSIEEEITVTAVTPIIDTKKSQVGIRVSKEMLMDLPNARNAWVVLQLAPGVLIDREDIAGNEAGQQSAYYGHGSSGNDNTWLVDGANITDNSALGAAPAYLNLSSYEELIINYGANDITNNTGGISLNFISKRGGNSYTGEFYLDVATKQWQLKNIPSDLEAAGYKGAGVDKVYLYGANFGGPIVKDKVWFYGSWGIQDIGSKGLTGIIDKTWLVSGYGKMNFQLFKNNRAEAYIEYDDKNKWNRTNWGAEYQASETMWNQVGPGYLYKFEDEQILGNLLLTGKAIYTDGGFHLIPVALGSGKYEWDSYWPIEWHSGNIDDYLTNRNQLNLNFTGTYFKEKLLGADHEIKFGGDYITATLTTMDLYEGNLSVYENTPDWNPFPEGALGVPYREAWIIRDYFINSSFTRYSAFLQDTVTFGKFAVNVAVRYDREKSIIKNESVPASPFLSTFLPAVSVAKYDPGIAWEVISPRLSITYDIFGTGKDVIKLSLARYGSQSGYDIASFDNPLGWSEIDLLWRDINGDRKVTGNELYGYDAAGNPTQNISDPSTWLWYSSLDLKNPANPSNPNKYDSKFNSPLLDELTISYQKELFTDFAASLELFAKKRYRMTYNIPMTADGTLITEAVYTKYRDYTFPKTGETKTIYRRPTSYMYTYRTTSDNRYERYYAAQIVLNKRLSNKWMMNASFTYDDWKFYYNEFDLANPNNKSFYDGGVVAPQSGGSGLTNIFVSSRWMAKLSGLYQLPYGINIAGTVQAREGYVMPNYVRMSVPGFGTVSLYSGKMGDTRLPTFWELSLRVEKVFNLGETRRVIVSADAFNVTNNATALKKQNLLTASNYGKTVRILNPTVFRFGVRFTL